MDSPSESRDEITTILMRSVQMVTPHLWGRWRFYRIPDHHWEQPSHLISDLQQH